MRTLFLTLFAALFVALPASAQDTVQEGSKSGTVALDADGRIEIDNHEGRITISTWDRDEVEYSAEVQQAADAEVARRTSVEVESSSSRLSLRTVHQKSNGDDGWSFWGNSGSNIMPVHYTLTVPRSARVRIDDHESEIRIDGLRAAVEVDTHDGPVELRNHEGDAEIDSHDGDITIDGLTGDLEIDTHESDVTITGFRGALEIENHDAEVDVSFAALDDDVEIDTHDGDTTLRLPADAGFALDAEFGDDDIRIRGDFDVASLRDRDGDYRGDVNGGGPEIRFSSHDADFRLEKQ